MSESFWLWLTWFARGVLALMGGIVLYSVGAAVHQFLHKRRLRKQLLALLIADKVGLQNQPRGFIADSFNVGAKAAEPRTPIQQGPECF